MGEHDHRSGGANIEVEELNRGADKRGAANDFIARVYRNMFRSWSKASAVACILFSYFSERIAILRTAKVIFQCVTKAKNGQKARGDSECRQPFCVYEMLTYS